MKNSILANKGTKTETINTLLGMEPESQKQANNINHIAIQTLYAKLKEREIISSVDLMEGTKHPEEITEDNKLIVRKLVEIGDAI